MENTKSYAVKNADKASVNSIPGVLKAGKDFGYINGSGKPILFKAGAEKLLNLLRLNIESLSCVNNVTDLDRNFLDFTYRCSVKDSKGNVTGISEGSSNSLEECFRMNFVTKDVNLLTREDYRKKLKNGDGKWLRRNGRWVWTEKENMKNAVSMKNFIQKTAQRRAFVGAVLMAAGLSDSFKQD